MTPPFWLDEPDQRVPTRPYPRPTCDREWPDYRHRFEHLLMIGLARPRLVLRIVNWCGHSQDVVAWPGARMATEPWCPSWRIRMSDHGKNSLVPERKGFESSADAT
jgi:hypothetical protein